MLLEFTISDSLIKLYEACGGLVVFQRFECSEDQGVFQKILNFTRLNIGAARHSSVFKSPSTPLYTRVFSPDCLPTVPPACTLNAARLPVHRASARSPHLPYALCLSAAPACLPIRLIAVPACLPRRICLSACPPPFALVPVRRTSLFARAFPCPPVRPVAGPAHLGAPVRPAAAAACPPRLPVRPSARSLRLPTAFACPPHQLACLSARSPHLPACLHLSAAHPVRRASKTSEAPEPDAESNVLYIPFVDNDSD
ncbi:hypothetical protein GGX14DRAFT_651614 [Mycena pura]|uniref:Uncharacterized protein n=1 Tax=Mycena pura TaxID=153505 RepID=A0AAD6V5S4_9AGAR|nr:hypothetical protein GGX14DRAFT_651614 [Mycena pura]